MNKTKFLSLMNLTSGAGSTTLAISIAKKMKKEGKIVKVIVENIEKFNILNDNFPQLNVKLLDKDLEFNEKDYALVFVLEKRNPFIEKLITSYNGKNIVVLEPSSAKNMKKLSNFIEINHDLNNMTVVFNKVLTKRTQQIKNIESYKDKKIIFKNREIYESVYDDDVFIKPEHGSINFVKEEIESIF